MWCNWKKWGAYIVLGGAALVTLNIALSNGDSGQSVTQTAESAAPTSTLPATTAAAVTPATAISTRPPTTTQPTVTPSTPNVAGLIIADENRTVKYDRDNWGHHHSDSCAHSVGLPDPFTGLIIDDCEVDHVVALKEAHESGGWAWPESKRDAFSAWPGNLLAVSGCVNSSKQSRDAAEWTPEWVAGSGACDGGYDLTADGWCVFAEITVTTKAHWGLTVDQAEYNALTGDLAHCYESVVP